LPSDGPAREVAPTADSLPIALVTLSLDGALRFANARLHALLEAPPGSLEGATVDRVLTTASGVLYQSYLLPLLKLHGRVEEFRVDLRGPRGEPIAALAYATLRAADEGVEARVDMTFAPIHERRRLEDDLVRIRQAAELAPVMLFQQVVRGDESSFIPYVTNVLRTLYGLTPQQVRERDDALFDRVHPEDRAGLLEARRHAGERGGLWEKRYRVTLADGRERMHELVASGRRVSDHETHWHGVIADVSDRLALEGALRDKDAAERASRAKSDFLARMSHEFRTPLNGIIGFSQLLTTPGAPPLLPSQRQQLQLIERSGRSLLHLVNEVLDIARVESGALELQLRPVSTRARCAAVLALSRPAAAAAGVTLSLEPGPDAWATADPNRLGQILSNLVSNAIKYNRLGGRVRVLCRASPGAVHIEVHDEGPGLDPGQLRELFQPFRRLGRGGASEGTGLGLVIARQLAEAMGGEITVQSEPEVGSVFSVRLPAATPDTNRTRDSARPPPLTEAYVQRRSVLCVEDNEVNAKLIEALFARRPSWSLHLARDGASALVHAARAAPPDLLLLDLHLPDIDGATLLARLRAVPGWEEVRAVAASADAIPAHLSRARAAGFTACWTKPLDVTATLWELDALLDPR
jgi:signal transduction histidine kinase